MPRIAEDTVKRIMTTLNQLGIGACRECGSETLTAKRHPVWLPVGSPPDEQSEQSGYIVMFAVACMQCTNVRFFDVQALLPDEELELER